MNRDTNAHRDAQNEAEPSAETESRLPSMRRRRFVQATGAAGIAGVAGRAGASETAESETIFLPDMVGVSYWELLTFSCFQGLANRESERVYLHYSTDPNVWLEWYRGYDHLTFEALDDPYALFERVDPSPTDGYVVVDEQAPVTANVAANYASTRNLLPVTQSMLESGDLPDHDVELDLRGEFEGINFRESSKLEAYEWAVENQWPEANHTRVANLSTPPSDRDPEDIPANGFYWSNRSRDFTVAEGGFFFELSSAPRFEEERALKEQILSEMDDWGYVFGWHTAESLEIYHIRQLSENRELALGASTQADNFSFHSRVEIPNAVKRFEKKASRPRMTEGLDDKVYLTFVLSDGDSLNFLTRGAQNGQWVMPERGDVPFGWEMQALLADVGPGLLDYFQATATDNDRFGGGVSGIGYTHIGAMSDATLQRYLDETKPYLAETGLASLTVMSQGLNVTDEMRGMYAETLGDKLNGLMRGYVRSDAVGSEQHLYGHNRGSGSRGGSGKRSRIPIDTRDAFAWQPAAQLESHIDHSLDGLVSAFEMLAETVTQRPLFAGTHVFGHALNVADIVELSNRLDSDTFEIVGPNEFNTLFAEARPGTVVIEPPEGELPEEKVVETGDDTEIPYTFQSFGNEPVDVETEFDLTADSAGINVTRSGSATLGPNETAQFTEFVDVPASAGGHEGQLDITVDDGTSSSASMPIRFITVDGSVSAPYATFAATSAQFEETDDEFVIDAAGENLAPDADEYATIYDAETGLGTKSSVVTKVASQSGTPSDAMAGLLVKNDLTESATRWMGTVCVAVSPEGGFTFQWSGKGAGYVTDSTQAGDTAYPCWLKLEKNHNQFTGYYSTDGESWTKIGSANMFSSEGTPDAGMFVTAGSDDTRSRATFDGLNIENAVE